MRLSEAEGLQLNEGSRNSAANAIMQKCFAVSASLRSSQCQR